MEKLEILDGLRSLRRHFADMAGKSDPDNIWEQDVEVLDAAWAVVADLPTSNQEDPKLDIWNSVLAERQRQDKKWGFPQENTFCEWGCILAEEAGELCKELNECNFGRGDRRRVLEEAVQVAAVAMSIMEHYHVAEAITSELGRGDLLG